VKVSAIQHMLIRIAMANKACPGHFYPHELQWDPKTQKQVCIHGSDIAAGIRALGRKGLAELVTDLHPYAFKLTPDTMAAFEAGNIEEKS
jgi:hypothetical protein